MAEERIFVGRKDELEQFGKVLEDPKGQAVLVVGQAGMGKTWLVNEMVRCAEIGILSEKTQSVKCWSIRYEITPNDAVTSTMERIIMDARKAAAPIREKLGMTGKHKEKWKALFGAGKVIPVFGTSIKAFGELVLSFGGKTGGDTRANFIKALKKLSECITNKERAIFIIDPEKLMPEKSDHDWGVIVRDLPNKIKLIFPQRTQDVLVTSDEFCALEKVRRIPEENLDVLDDKAIDDLLYAYSKITKYSVNELQDAMSKYKGHPYAIAAALELLKAGEKPENLPNDPGGIAAAQWNRICEIGDDAVNLFESYAILEVGVPDDVVEAVSGLATTSRKRLQKDKYLAGLLREEGEGKRIYHAILADYILGQIREDEKKEYHGRVVGIYREKLAEAKKNKTKPDALSATRLPEHVLKAEGEEAFVDAFVNECFGFLLRLGLLDAATGLSMRALKFVKKDSKEEVSVMGDIGIIYKMRGALNKAKEIFTRILEIHKKIGPKKDMASDCANLGGIYVQLGMLEKAEKMFESALEIDQKLGNVYEAGDDYGKLGVLYIKRQDFHKAEQVLKKAITIHEEIERFDGVATNCGNLGRLYIRERKYDLAERMFLKALELHKKLGWVEGLAHDNVNLGSIHKERGDIAKAKEYWEKAVELYKEIGMPREVEKVESWIDKLNIKKQNAK
jgi:tetratricopeptide (TPR) repeat protein